MGWTRRVTRMVDKRNIYRIFLFGKPEELLQF